MLFENFVNASPIMLSMSAFDMSLSVTMRDISPDSLTVVLGRRVLGAAAVLRRVLVGAIALRGVLVGQKFLRVLVEVVVVALAVVAALVVLLE